MATNVFDASRLDSARRVQLVFSLVGLALICILGVVAAYRLGFGAMSDAADKNPERLREFTFPIWHSHPVSEHGFLVFLTPDGFAKKSAYANHSTPYLWFMDGLYHIQQRAPTLSMRKTGACLGMLMTLLAIGFVACKRISGQASLQKMILLALGFAYASTLPTYWIATAKFNVDNGFILVMPALIVLSHYASQEGWGGRKFWFWAVTTTLIMPMAGALFALGLMVQYVGHGSMRGARSLAAPVLLAAVAVVIYLEPVFVAKLLGFSSSNSPWAFRAGLDGDTTYFSNALNSVLFPFYRRPAFLVIIPAALVLVQWLSLRKHTELSVEQPIATDWTFVVNLFSFYVLTLLFWPQAVSIHPYLYDAVLIGPLVTWCIVNFSGRSFSALAFTLWSAALGVLIMFNLTSIAQAARNTDHAYPKWNLSSVRIG